MAKISLTASTSYLWSRREASESGGKGRMKWMDIPSVQGYIPECAGPDPDLTESIQILFEGSDVAVARPSV